MIGQNNIAPSMQKLGDTRNYSPREKVIIAGTEMCFSHWLTHNGCRVPFFHYYIDGKEYGYINHDLKREI